MTLNDRLAIERLERATLAPYAAKSADSRGRDAAESPARLRTEFQRDRDRIIHSHAFRCLEYKTQVYVTHEGDYFRTRLTHSMEVAQIARTLARALGLNGDLTEAIALAHDLGHTPFGHTGERVLNELLAGCGGFEHNAQSLRVVELLEERFHDRPGLNLTWEVRAGLAHHATAYDAPPANGPQSGDVEDRFESRFRPMLEAQLANLCDEIAYNHHDLDDALGMRLLEVDQLRQVPWLWELWEATRRRLPEAIDPIHLRYRALGALMDAMVDDVVDTSVGRLAAATADSPDAARRHPSMLIGFSEAMAARQGELRAFLMAQVYRHPATLRMQEKAARFFRRLFDLYKSDPRMLPRRQQQRIEAWGLDRVLADYLSGMTDRHCLEEYRSHFDPAAPGGAF
jgi:dGTPase